MPQQPPSLNELTPRARTLLDKALVGETDAVKARVLRLVLESDIDPEDPLFIVLIGLNYIKILLIDAPERFKSWGDRFLEDLETWTAAHQQTLDLIAQKAEATRALSETAGQLASMLTGLTDTCNALIRQLQAGYQTWGESWDRQQAVNAEVAQALEAIRTQLERQTLEVQKLSAAVQADNHAQLLSTLGIVRRPARKALLFGGVVVYATIGTAAFLTTTWFYINDRRLLHDTAEQIDYLLQKQNRRDCRDGLLPPDSPLCQ